MASIPELLPYIQFLGQMALIAAASIALYQLVQSRRERREQHALTVLSGLTTPEFRAAYSKIWELPLDASAEEIVARGPDTEAAIECAAMTFEVIGVMVHNRMVPLDAVDQAIGGFLRESWRRTGNYILWRREQVGSRRVSEWYQWLAEQLAVQTRRGEGAYDAFKDWRE